MDLHDYYCNHIKGTLDLLSPQVHSELLKVKGAYIVRYRVKDPEHVIDKAIRKKKNKDKIITKEICLMRLMILLE